MTLIFPCPLPAQKSYLVFVSPAGIGPPSSVKLTLAGYSLEVSIVDPLTSTNSSMKDYMADLSYNIRYWERHEDEEVWNTCWHKCTKRWVFFLDLCAETLQVAVFILLPLFYRQLHEPSLACLLVWTRAAKSRVFPVCATDCCAFVLAIVSHLWLEEASRKSVCVVHVKIFTKTNLKNVPQALIMETISTNSNVVALSGLKPLTWYCVRVQSYTKYYNRSSSFTSPLCMKNDGETFIQLLLCFNSLKASWNPSFHRRKARCQKCPKFAQNMNILGRLYSKQMPCCIRLIILWWKSPLLNPILKIIFDFCHFSLWLLKRKI